jgi:DNA-binding transcriptional MerR regulator/effector-binding domain-containing protein
MLSIGDFSRMTQLSVKTLRHYHDVGLIPPHHVDPSTGYRYYSYEQVPTAQVVTRLRALDMPVPEVKAVLAAAPDERNALISAHLGRLEDRLATTQDAVRALRDLIERPAAGPPLQHRSVAATPSVAVHATVDRDDLFGWFSDAVTEVRDAVQAERLVQTGPPGGLYGFDVFANDRGPATVFIPVEGGEFTVPAAELVVIRHRGPHDDVDLAYSELGEYATRHELSIEAPLREYYDRFSWDTDDSSQWLTDLCWPIFRTAPAS